MSTKEPPSMRLNIGRYRSNISSGKPPSSDTRLSNRLPHKGELLDWKLSRSYPSCGGRLDNLVADLGGFPLEIFDLYLPMLRLIYGGSLVDIFHPVAQHAVDQAGELGGHGLDRAGGT